MLGNLKNFDEVDISNKTYTSCLADHEILTTPSSEHLSLLSTNNIRNLIVISEFEVAGHTRYGDVFILNFRNSKINLEIIREGSPDDKNKMYNIASIDENNFLTCGNWGRFWSFQRNSEGIWKKDVKKNSSNAHFGLGVYDEESETYIANSFRGKTRILNRKGIQLKKLLGLDPNLQNLLVLPELIASVDYHGNSQIYSKSDQSEENYIKIQTIDCDSQTKVYPKILFHDGYFYAAFPNSLWRYSKDLSIIQEISINCVDIMEVENQIVILTDDDVVLINQDKFETPEDYIDYEYLVAGIIGYTDSGKSTLCYRLIYNDYKENLKPTSGVLTWYKDLIGDQKISIKDIPGQKSEIQYYFPKLKGCDLILVLCKKRNSLDKWRETIDLCEILREKHKIKNFIFLRSKSDTPGEKARKSAIKELLEEKEFNPKYLIDVSAKNGEGLEELKCTLTSNKFWENSKISTENKIKTKLIENIGRARSGDQKKIKLKHLEIPEDLNKRILENILIKISQEGDLYYIPERKEILLDTEDMGQVESFILMILDESDGLIKKDYLIKEIEEEFESIEISELEYYYEEFIDYLLKTNKITEIFKDIFLVKDRIQDDLQIPNALLCTKIEIENGILMRDMLSVFERLDLTLDKVADNGFKFISEDGGMICITFPEMDEFNIEIEIEKLQIFLKVSDLTEKCFKSLYRKLRNEGLKELPKLLNFHIESEESVGDLSFLFNYPNEAPFIDFKREINYKKKKSKVYSKSQKEILKDIIALGNSAYLYGNHAYLVIGVEEKNGDYNGLKDVPNQSVLLQQIAYLCRKFIKIGFNINHHSINIFDLYELVDSGKIEKDIPFSHSQKLPSCDENLMILEIIRDPVECLELKKNLRWRSDSSVKKIPKGKSWIRVTSHTFDILNTERKKLFSQ